MRTSPVWNPQQYGKYAAERGRPFVDLVSRIGAEAPARVVDLGCGPANLTVTLLDRWPDATVHGVDSSPEMIAAAAEYASDRLDFEVADLRDWIGAAEPESVDVVVSNATLQWLPDQLDLLPRLVSRLRPGGWLAIQIPGNSDAPLHAILRELARTGPYDEYAAPLTEYPELPDAASYVEVLGAAGCTVSSARRSKCNGTPGTNRSWPTWPTTSLGAVIGNEGWSTSAEPPSEQWRVMRPKRRWPTSARRSG